MSQIVGVFLVKNEEFYIAWSLMNSAKFFDHILVLDNLSSDRTQEIVRNISTLHSNIELIQVKNANNTQMYLNQYIGTDTWVLGVDGDEVHYPDGLARMRNRINSGEFSQYWSVSSTYLHVTSFDFENSIVYGYPSPPAKAGLKLYNFNAIDNWNSKWRKRERLHGKGLEFRDGFSKNKTFSFSKETQWWTADFKCLHLCFLRRSSQEFLDDSHYQGSIKSNPAESRFLRRISRSLERLGPNYSDYRIKRYARGAVKPFELSGFGRPDNFESVDKKCHEVMEYLMRVRIEI